MLCGSGQFGELKFSLSCNYETRETFDLAVALLHSFQYNESEKAFVKVIDSDPNCPMAYWGIAMSIYHAAWFPPSEEDLINGSKIVEIAKELSMDDKQRDYINAIDAFYTNWERATSLELQDFIHTPNFVLIDKEKRIRGIYDGTDEEDIKNIIRDIKTLKSSY